MEFTRFHPFMIVMSIFGSRQHFRDLPKGDDKVCFDYVNSDLKDRSCSHLKRFSEKSDVYVSERYRLVFSFDDLCTRDKGRPTHTKEV